MHERDDKIVSNSYVQGIRSKELEEVVAPFHSVSVRVIVAGSMFPLDRYKLMHSVA